MKHIDTKELRQAVSEATSGMVDLLVGEKLHPMVWSPLAGGQLFTSTEAPCQRAMAKITEIAACHGVEAATIVYAWILYHPVGAAPISGSNQTARLEHAIKALEVRLERYEWYEIYAASGQQSIR